jgi:pimeloyl-ACP methyl ester carboxylesterase
MVTGKENGMPYAVNNGVRIRYETEGSGPPLLLHIGGIGGALEDWYDAGYVAALRDDYQLILIDPRGQGQSDKPHDSASYARSERIGDVCAVLDAVGVERTHFWGYSSGGHVGYGMGVYASDRLLSLILGGASPLPSPLASVEEFPLFQLVQLGMEGMVAALEQDDPEFWASEGERARWLDADATAISAALRGWFPESLTAEKLSTVQVPTCIYCGTNDNPEPKARAAQAMPNATFVALEGLDHAAAINRSALVLPHITAFLDRHAGHDEQPSTTRDDQFG